MPESSRLRIALSVLVASFLLAGVVAVVVNDDSPKETGLSTAADSTATTAAADAAVDAGAGGSDDGGAAKADGGAGSASKSTGSTAKPGGSTSSDSTVATGSKAPADRPASADPGQAQPTKIGTYAYESVVDGKTTESTLAVEAKSSGAGETRQIQTLKSEQNELRNEMVWKADGLSLATSSGSTGGGLGGDCDWEPDLLILKMPLAVGTSWSSDSSCSGQSPYGPYTLKAHFEGTISGTARLTVGGQQVDVWIIDGKQKIDITATYQAQEIKATQEAITKTWFAPKQGLTVREESTSTTNSPQGTRTQKSSRQLKSLSPR